MHNFIVLKKWLNLWVYWRSSFKNKNCLSWENQSWSLYKSGQIFIRFTNIDETLISFVFSSWIIMNFLSFFITSIQTNVCQVHLAIRMQHVITRKDLTSVHVILAALVMDLHAMVNNAWHEDRSSNDQIKHL